MTMLTTRGSTVAARAVASRQVRSLSTPKMHNATGNWDALKAKRPIDSEDLHKVFHPPYDKVTVYLLTGFIVVGGCGSMCYGVAHQQYKQGYWK